MKCLVLDAMGVLFQAADDVVELLIPFIAECGGEEREEAVQSAYLDASLGQITADEFWRQVGVDPQREDDYLARHRLSNGVLDLLESAKQQHIPVWCLSNDIGRWSQKLRENFGLERLLSGSIISGDVHVRKPDPRIYAELVSRTGFAAAGLIFVDDRPKNVEAAQLFGIESIQFDPRQGFTAIVKRITMALVPTKARDHE